MTEELEESKKRMEKWLRSINCTDNFIEGALYGFDRAIEHEEKSREKWAIEEIIRGE